MARHENENIDDFDLPNIEMECLYFLDNGESVDSLDSQSNKRLCAKSKYSNQTGNNYYYAKVSSGGKLYNPHSKSTPHEDRFIWKLRKVKQTVFDLYISFLKLKKKSLLFKAEREM